MPVTVEGVLSTEEMLLRLDTTAKKRVRRSLIKKAHRIRDLAERMAPVDEGNLEASIKVRGDEEGRERDELGRFMRTEVEVYVDTDMPVPERPGKVVGDYAFEIHEHLTPMGPKQLGPRSLAKQNGQSEQVGGGYMERAALEVDGEIDHELVDILRDFG